MSVDAVYTWVNGADPDWKKTYESAVSEKHGAEFFHPSVNNTARFQNRGEILYSIKSVRKFAPWIRNIYIVTNCALPKELLDMPRIFRVDHEDIFPDKSVLPTFNSRAIEANLHRIDSLSERFLYFNDDVFLCREVCEQDFFNEDGSVNIFPGKHDVPYHRTSGLRPVDYGILNACNLMIRDFDFKPEKKLHHAPFALLRSTLYEIEEKYSETLTKTRAHRFRDQTDLPLATTLHAYYSLVTKRAVIRNIDARYVDIGDPLFVFLIHRISPLRRGKYMCLCLNEVVAMRRFACLRDRLVERFMRDMFDEK
jgi:hypothetical protein